MLQRSVVELAYARMRQHRVDGGWGQEQRRDPVLLDAAHHFQRVRLRDHHLGRPHRQQRKSDAAGSVGHRRGDEVNRRILIGHAGAEVRDHRREVQVRQHHALGPSGRAAGRPDRRDVVRAERNVGLRLAVLAAPGRQRRIVPVGPVDADIAPDAGDRGAVRVDLAGERAVIEEPLAVVAAGVDVVFERVPGIQRHPGAACPEDAENAGERVDVVVAQHGTDPLGPDAVAGEAVADPVGERADLRNDSDRRSSVRQTRSG